MGRRILMCARATEMLHVFECCKLIVYFKTPSNYSGDILFYNVAAFSNPCKDLEPH